MIQEIEQIPQKALPCYNATKNVTLPKDVPYIGMGSSYFAPLALQFSGTLPVIASEYALYEKRQQPKAVLISQSGESSETVWCKEFFENYIAIVNNPKSTLAKEAHTVIDIHAGPEEYSSTKTYINTLIALYNGLGIDSLQAIRKISDSMDTYKEKGQEIAQMLWENKERDFYIIGSGPNIATAQQAALIMEESIKKSVKGMLIAQYDHGPKEAAKNSVVVAIDVKGPSHQRTQNVLSTIKKAGAVTSVISSGLDETISPIETIIPLFYAVHFLMEMEGIDEPFSVGSKVTRV